MSMTIAIQNSILFYKEDNKLQGFGNVNPGEERYGNIYTLPFTQKFQPSDKITIQIKTTISSSDTPISVVVTDTAGKETSESHTIKATYTDFYIYECDIDFFNYAGETIYIQIDQGTDVYKSACITVEDLTESLENGDYIELKYFNNDNISYNGYNLDYSTGITNKIYIPAKFMDYSPSGDQETYDNIGEKSVINETYYRSILIKTEPIPRQLMEKIIIATSQDVVIINDERYIRDEMPDTEAWEQTNLFTAEIRMTRRLILGLNAFDTGIDQTNTTDMTKLYVERNKNTNFSITVLAGYYINSINAFLPQDQSGQCSIKVGLTAGGDEVVPGMIATKDYVTRIHLNRDVQVNASGNYPVDRTLYFTISLTGGALALDVEVETSKTEILT